MSLFLLPALPAGRDFVSAETESRRRSLELHGRRATMVPWRNPFPSRYIYLVSDPGERTWKYSF